jgi:hypothetical protein
MNTTPSSKADPEQYARVVLWHLAESHATVRMMHARVLGLELDPHSKEAMAALFQENAKIREIAEGYYTQALKQSRIQPVSDYPPPPQSSGGGDIGSAAR